MLYPQAEQVLSLRVSPVISKAQLVASIPGINDPREVQIEQVAANIKHLQLLHLRN